MSKYLKYIFIFIFGAIAGQLALMIIFGTWNTNPEKQAYGVSDAYVQERFKDVCDYLKSKNCSCYPVIHTDLSCKTDLDEYMLGKSLTNQSNK